jgi:hypothetical protein
MPGFYVPGYTEALATLKEVRIIPDFSFLEMFPREFMYLFKGDMQFPCYYIPIRMDRAHYGFILKGASKQTPRFTTWYPFFNLQALKDPRPYVFVTEGIKDAGILLQMGYPAMAMLTASVSEVPLQAFKEFNKTPILIPDNDGAGATAVEKMHRKLRAHGIPYRMYMAQGHKDLGDWYVPEYNYAVSQTLRVLEAMADQVQKEVMSCKLFK